MRMKKIIMLSLMVFAMSCAKKVAVSPAPVLTDEMAAAKETYESATINQFIFGKMKGSN